MRASSTSLRLVSRPARGRFGTGFGRGWVTIERGSTSGLPNPSYRAMFGCPPGTRADGSGKTRRDEVPCSSQDLFVYRVHIPLRLRRHSATVPWSTCLRVNTNRKPEKAARPHPVPDTGDRGQRAEGRGVAEGVDLVVLSNQEVAATPGAATMPTMSLMWTPRPGSDPVEARGLVKGSAGGHGHSDPEVGRCRA